MKTLDLSHTQLTAADVSAISSALEGNTTLQDLSLFGCEIKCEGAEAIARALSANGTLQRLNLGGTGIGDKGGEAIISALEKHNHTLQHLNLGFQYVELLARADEVMVRNRG